MSQVPDHVEPTGSIEPLTPTVVDPSQVPPAVLAALQQAKPPLSTGGPPQWTEATSAAVHRIGTIIAERCPEWAWAPWHFIPDEAQINAALVEAGYKQFDAVGEDIAYDPEGVGRAQIQTINWDAHYKGPLLDPSKGRVVSDGRPENGGIFPIITIGTPDPELHAEDIVLCLQSWARRYGAPVPEPAPAPAVTEAPKPNGATPVSGAMAWACGLCSTVVRQAPDGTMPSFVCPGCGATQKWRQPTIDELANISPAERAAMRGAQPFGVGFPTSQPMLGRAPVQGPAGDNDFYAQAGVPPGGAPYQGQQAFVQQEQMAGVPDPETRAIADVCWLLESIPPEARVRVVRYIRDRWG